MSHTAGVQLAVTKAQARQSKIQYESEKHYRCHQTFKVGPCEAQKDINPDRVAGICQWGLTHPRYLRWLNNAQDDLLWISADPGCGKSGLTKSLIDNELRTTDQHTVCYFFFEDNEEQDSVATALCALLHQLFSHQPWRILVAAGYDDKAHDVTCILDALQECRLLDCRWVMDMLSRFHTQTSTSSSATRRGRLKFLVTSRPYDDMQMEFQKMLKDLPTIRLRGEEENDQIHREIDLVIRTGVEQLATDLRLSDGIKAQLKTRLLEMGHRTYLWLYLAIESVYQTYRSSLRPEEASIASLPSSVEDAYEKILSYIDQEQRSTLLRLNGEMLRSGNGNGLW